MRKAIRKEIAMTKDVIGEFLSDSPDLALKIIFTVGYRAGVMDEREDTGEHFKESMDIIERACEKAFKKI